MRARRPFSVIPVRVGPVRIRMPLISLYWPRLKLPGGLGLCPKQLN